MGFRRAYGAIALVSFAVFVLLASTDSFERLYRLSRAHEDWQLDELLWLFFVGTFALLAVLILDRRRLKAEMARRRAAEEAAHTLSCFDTVTGMPNRGMFLKVLEEKIELAHRGQTGVALLLIDIDNFLAINDRLGHVGGDRVLQAVAQRLRPLAHAQDQQARLGSDEFALLLPFGAKAEHRDIFRLAERILLALRQPFPMEGGAVSLTVSIGIAKVPGDAGDEAELMRVAEMALHQAKAAGKNRYALFDSNLDSLRRERLALESELRGGIRAHEIVAYYQPVVRLSTHEPVGAEALARWLHPERGPLTPQVFINVAQDIGLSGSLLEEMLRHACADTAAWPSALTVAVNISPQQLLEATLAERILALLDTCGYPPGRLEIEITENALLLDFEAARRTMAALKARGVQLSLDDFGTGYSSLTHLHQLPFDKIKIDRTFILGVLDDPQRRKIVSSTISLGRALGLVTVAEGVETEAQAEWLRAEGCDLAQGYYFAAPMPAPEAAAFMVGGRCAKRAAVPGRRS